MIVIIIIIIIIIIITIIIRIRFLKIILAYGITPHTPTPPHGRLARRAQVGLRRNPSGVVRPRRQRAVTSRHTAATLNTVERALRGTTSADTGVT